MNSYPQSSSKFFAVMVFCLSLLFTGCNQYLAGQRAELKLPQNTRRCWIGPDYWANPLQDWQLADGRIECVQSGGDRNVYLLTRELSNEPGDLKMSVALGRLEPAQKQLTEGWVGFKIGIRGEFNDYRDSAVRGDGYRAGIYTNGRLFIGKFDRQVKPINQPLDNITLVLNASYSGDACKITLRALDKNGRELAKTQRDDISPDWLHGGIALVCSAGKVTDMPDKRVFNEGGNWGFKKGTRRQGNVRFWFSKFAVSGSKVIYKPEQAFGPILFSQYTLSNGILKMTAQMPPVGPTDSQTVGLQIKENRKWTNIATAKIDPLSRTATFRVPLWDTSRDVPYRLVYKLRVAGGKFRDFYHIGKVRKEPWDKDEIVVAAFTGNNDLGFPNNDFVKHVKFQNPDVLFFSGDQIYEGVGGYGTQVAPLEKACIDYLRKWYLYGWAYKDLLKDRPAISIPDDHDVYHGNLWGAGGKATPRNLRGFMAQDAGGYKMPPEWVNMVQRTQTSHLPDPFDPTPVKQGITVYYCNMNYAGVSFAILEDRKFKSAPKMLLPEARIRNGWPQNPDFDAKTQADVPGAVLLGDRQLKFLHTWADDWSHNTWMKIALSQTIFANVATLPKKEMSDGAVPRLRILKKGEYPPDDRPVSDFDSDGWPQTGRNKAVKLLRKAFALHIAGDQHLGSTIQYGVDAWRDAGFALCVPSVSNVWPRRWYPQNPGKNRKPGAPRYTGDFEDGFGNKITVYAVSNPIYTGLKPSRLYDRATGYGIVRLNRKTRSITIECWPRLSDPAKPHAREYPGWPIKINQLDNYNRKAFGYLPTINIKGTVNPVIQVIDEKDNETLYSLRINGRSFQPRVFAPGSYTVKIGQPDLNQLQTLTGLKPAAAGQKSITVKF